MKRKIRIFLLFLVLSVTPFLRGCEIVYGFPFPLTPAAESLRDMLLFMFKPGTWHIAAFFIVNTLICVLLAKIIARNEKKGGLLSFMITGLDINLSVIWFTYLLLSFSEMHKSIEVLGNFFLGVIYANYMCRVPADFLAAIMGRMGLDESGIGLDIAMRLWFVVITLLLGAVICGAAKLINMSIAALAKRKRKAPVA